MTEKRWEILAPSVSGREAVLKAMLDNRDIADRSGFFQPPSPAELLSKLPNYLPDLNLPQLNRAVRRIEDAIKNREKITVWGDYDVDGVAATAVLWQALYRLGADALPYIPDRFGEGYGLNKDGIKKLKEEGRSLIITVDSGITAVEEAEFARKLGVDLIITDHHLKPRKLPATTGVVHTTALCGAGVAWVLASQIEADPVQMKAGLDLVAIATVADLQPVLGANRALMKSGFEVLNRLERPGIAALAEVARLRRGALGTYAAGWVLGPRINAVGRMRHGIESLRLLCTSSPVRARQLARLLDQTNVERKSLTAQMLEEARKRVSEEDGIIIVHHDRWHEGVIGLVAGRLVEEHGRPAVVIARGKEFSKGSARSVNGLDIVEVLRAHAPILEDVGGHAAAAGFTIRTANLEKFAAALRRRAAGLLVNLDPRPVLKIDLPLPLAELDIELVRELEKLAPHGVGNPEPIFLAETAEISSVRKVGRENQHLKLELSPRQEAIWFGSGSRADLRPGQQVSLVYTPEIEEWEGRERVVLRVRDLKLRP